MEFLNVSRNDILVSVKPSYLDKKIFEDLILPFVALTIDVSIITLTVFKEPFKSAIGVKNVVILQCLGGLGYTTFKLCNYISAIIWIKYKVRFTIVISTFYIQLNYFLYNVNFTVPSIITYWRFMLIVYQRETSAFENIALAIFSLLFNFICLIHTTLYATNLSQSSLFTKFFTYGPMLEDYMAWFDIAPQVISGIIAFFMNIGILVKIRIETIKTVARSKSYSNEVTLTINLLFHTIMPLFFIFYANIYYNILINAGIESPIAAKIYHFLELSYLIISPLSLVLFIKSYRNYFFSSFYKMNTIFVSSVTGRIIL
uniref:Serpentine receptor class gamma n=1 Tax=Parastrongyloides trichosuri TaxID=131310 RepID=A0A0N4ZB24_PARTI